MQFVPPQIHKTNPAERAVRTAKNHLIALLSSTHPDFPDDLWDCLLPHAEITLNLLRPWRPDPSLSAWSRLHRRLYDFAAHPLHPPDQLCLAFSGPDHRLSWDPHGDRAFMPSHTTAATAFILSPPALNAPLSPLDIHPPALFSLCRVRPFPTPSYRPHFIPSLPHSRRHGFDRAGLQRP